MSPSSFLPKNLPITGTHILGEISCDTANAALTDSELVEKQVIQLLANLDLSNLGTVSHSFNGGGYTMIYALAESHLSIHTWPELSYVTLDVFICDFSRDNSKTCDNLFERIAALYLPGKITKRVIKR